MEITPIAYIKNDFSDKFGIPRQSGTTGVVSKIVFNEGYRDASALRGLDGFSHIWLIWGFSENIGKGWSPTVRPPRLGGNRRVGVFATRSPFRPNPLGLSCVKIVSIGKERGNGNVLYVSGADMLDGTPIFDIKPYVSYTDSVPDAACGFAEEHKNDFVPVVFPEELYEKLPEGRREQVKAMLAQDPRPAYQNDGERVYGFGFAGYEIRFRYSDGAISVVSVEKTEKAGG